MKTTLTTRTGHEATRSGLKTAGLMGATPLIGLAFVVLTPFAGIAALGWFALKALAHHTREVRDVALFFAAPLIGLAYVVLMPVAALAALAWYGAKALVAHPDALKTAGMMVATPFVGLAYVLLLPVVGLMTLATMEFRHLTPMRHAAA